MTDYDIRPYREDDREGFLALYETVLGGEATEAWFEWKYVDNPYADHVPMFVATATISGEETIVGARPFFALELATADGRTRALQPGDTMVHPDHRRQGLFTRMTERAIDRYRDDVALFFNFPNDQSGPGYRKLGWADVGEQATAYRIGDLAGWTGTADAGVLETAAIRVGGLALRGYAAVRDTLGSSGYSGEVWMAEDVPVDSLVWAYRTDVPEALHAVRDERFYDWRFENPRRTYDAYVAETDGVDAGLVVGTHEEDGVTVTEVTDVVPLAGEDREPAVVALLAHAVTDHPGTDVFAAHPDALPDGTLSTLGFLSDSSPPLSIAASPTNHMARPYDRAESLVGGAIEPRGWCISFAERDTA